MVVSSSNQEFTVLSLFDGISCGQIALERSGHRVDKYFASEIDKNAIKITQKNYPNTIQLGSVVDLDTSRLPPITLLQGGSPCQSFSFAGKRKGMSTKDEQEILTLDHYLELKSEDYEFEGQSYLFWEYMRILKEANPKYFLLENVMMGSKWEKILSKAIGVNPICINSSLVSAQHRQRLYWTNIGLTPQGLFGDMYSSIEQPKDKGILLKDIIEEEVDEKYYMSQEKVDSILAKSPPIQDDTQLVIHNMMPRSGDPTKGGTGHLTRTDGKTYCLDTGTTNVVEVIGNIKFGRTDDAKKIRRENMAKGKDTTPFAQKEMTGVDAEKMATITSSSQKDNLILLDFSHKNEGIRYYEDKSPIINARDYKEPRCFSNGVRIRKLTPIEYERLQTVNDNYTEGVSNSARYKALGNGWTVDVIGHIYSYMEGGSK